VDITPSISDDALFFDRFLAGDDVAFAELFDRHNHRLFVYCMKFVGDAEQAEDITQELWERVIRLRLNPQPVHNPGGYLLTMARNLCINHVKRKRHMTRLDDLSEAQHPAGEGEKGSDLEDAVRIALTRLPEEYREVLILNAYCGYRFDEIATMLGKSADSIWMRASRARTKLRKEVIALIGTEPAKLQRALTLGKTQGMEEQP
jgi:RNA polymerase sigma-70 factor (ECF subfamily)